VVKEFGECAGRGDALLAAGGQIAADAAEHMRAFRGTEAAGDFLMHFRHADIVFPLVVGERSFPGGHEAQNLVLEVA